MSGAWIFGYGSLVSPASVARTIGRTIDDPTERLVAHLHGFGRRWNYGSLNLRGDWTHDGIRVTGGVVISLGLTAAADETCNGVVVRVTAEELAALDWRERDYERTEIGHVIDVDGEQPRDAPIVTYVPRPSSIARYEAARDEGRAAIRASYWTLVDEAFVELGGDHAERYRSTPPPDVPVADIALTMN